LKLFFVGLLLLSSSAYTQVLPDSGAQVIPKNDSSTLPAGEEFVIPETIANQKSNSKYKRRVIDLLAIPHKGETYIGASYGYDNLSSSSPIGQDEFKTTSHQLNVFSERALTENLSIQAEIGYLLANKANSGSENLGNSKGLTDPYFGINYRALDISRDRFDLNLSAYYSPSFQEGTYSTSNKDGNGVRGTRLIGFKAGIGRREELTSWAFIIDFFNMLEGSVRNAESGSKTKISSWQAISFSGEYMKAISQKIFLKGQLGIKRIGGKTYTYEDQSWDTSKVAHEFPISGTGYLEFDQNKFFTSSLAFSHSTDGYTDANAFSLALGSLIQF
jgi:hypothetical protein